jgi:tetratricopeptide (TPR) repeat protein
MKYSSEGFSDSRRRHRRRALSVLIIAMAAITVISGGVLFARARMPILPVVETSQSLDAVQLWQDGLYLKTEATTTDALSRYPMDDIPLTLRGFSRFYLAMEQVDPELKQEYLVNAVRDLRRVLLLPAPQLEPQVRYVLGKSYFHRGAFFLPAAIRELEFAYNQGIDQLDLLEYLALANRELGYVEEAIMLFQKAIDRDGEEIHRLSLADLLILQGQYESADDLLQRVIAETSDLILQQHGMLSRGKMMRELGDYEGSLEEFDAVLEINASSAEAHFHRGETFLAMERTDRARFEWREALRLNPNHIESFQRLQDY